MLFTTKWLAAIFDDLNGNASDSIKINEVTTDSRKKTHQSLFIPLVGEKFDGHHYMKEAFNQGAVAAIWDKTKEVPDFLPQDFPLFFVDDTLAAMQKLATCYRGSVDPAVIGVTGSNGKTTTKDLIAAVIAPSIKTHYTKGNLNNQIGVPLTILSMPADTKALVVEMGMNHFGEIETLSKIAKPDYAVITNIGESHIEYLGSREGIAKAKMEIAQGLSDEGHLLIDGDEALLRQSRYQNSVITCGFELTNDVHIQNVKLFQDSTRFQLSDGEEYTLPLLGSHHALNASFAVTIATLLGIEKPTIKQALTSLELTSMRFEMLAGKNGSSIINDAYNASPTSMKASVNVVKELEGFKQKVLVLGDIFELGDQSKSLHQTVADSIDDSFDAVFTLGEDSLEITLLVKKRYQTIDCRHFTSREKLSIALKDYLKERTLILFKASRGMQFETFVTEAAEQSE
ncbi:UDP-N-acetylmuramoyl-tripeptide--D-alanyl-D-alanine ligase [Lentibacillus amyloliquefaciens]|uniref:UDP-N-acetylmuramoyl-tripeptide--D-alanyl-D-alanine ligase n=1 Tax=Lentibacillus amyloliquefaciens TaxID=1472767 RepID=A0A0U4EA41_9BACI|nr:UDP-N-acetylmuramoyl-tripeptide--D-alanyl-D-alanine ligase [Lentibacillus amyloliquefaciens]ALX47385.1 UDP-N-acetylmuramoylalanyl-D-glutamate--2,6-diaminopimelate ligase [Lentibacillus amyloliquefaciens]